MKKNLLLAFSVFLVCASAHLFAQSSTSSATTYHPRDQIALQLGAIQMGYPVPFRLVSGNATNAQRAANALVMGRNALDATVTRPAPKVQGFVKSPAVNTVEFRDQLYQAVEAVVTSPASGAIRGNVTIVGATRPLAVSSTLSLPPNAYSIPVPYAVEAATSVDTQALEAKLVALGVLPDSNQPITMVSTFAGSGKSEYTDGQGTAASFLGLNGITADINGNLYVIDSNKIRHVNSGGYVTTFTGSSISGYSEGGPTAARFNSPRGVAADKDGYLYVADTGNYRIRKISPSGNVTTLAGSGIQGYADGQGSAASFFFPYGIAVDQSGNVFISDVHRIRKISPSGNVTTLAGSGNSGYADGQGSAASFNYPGGVAVDSGGHLYVSDSENYRIRKITPSGFVTTLAGSGNSDYADGQGTIASFDAPSGGLAVDLNGNVYVADVDNYRIRKITPSGFVTTLAGSIHGYTDGQGPVAKFHSPYHVAVDSTGNVYVADSNYRIRKITAF
jgi:sugar lactone lactonase YvrE